MGHYDAFVLQIDNDPVRIAPDVIDQIMNTIGARPPESGGILLGPADSQDVTAYYFDQTASCSVVTYTPDIELLQKLIDERWTPAGLEFRGFVHSHPAGLDRLSSGDLEYIRRILAANPDMPRFIAPIVLPDEFRIQVKTVYRDGPYPEKLATLKIITRPTQENP